MIINSIQYTPQKYCSFSGISFRKPDKIKLFNEFCCKSPSIKTTPECADYFVRIEPGYTNKELSIKVDDGDFNEIGSSVLTIKSNSLYNDNIDVTAKRRKFSGAGSVMKLGELITMLENNMDKIELHSLGQAVYFHSKFKFKPTMTNIEDIKSYLLEDVLIRKNDKRFNKVCKLAEEWLNKNEIDDKSIEEGNNILYTYLQTVNELKLNREPEFEIMPGFDMVLTRKDIFDNKDYFNGLFKKFGIDYQISDSSY